MNFIIYFFIVILGYLTIAKSTNENYLSITKIEDLSKLPEVALHAPTTVILISIRSHGNFIPSHYFRLKLISAFYNSKILHVRVPKNLIDKYDSSLGMSIYSLFSKGKELSDNRITIPGFAFIGNPQFGRWIYFNNEERWSFYKAYQHLSLELGWGNFRPSMTDFKKYLDIKELNEFNPHPDLFGMNGSHTKKFLLMHMTQDSTNTKAMSLFLLKSYFNYKL